MYLGPAPQRGAPEPWTELPRELRIPSTPDRYNFLEGPSFDRAGNLYVVDIFAGRVYRISPAGQWEMVCEYDGQPNGLKIHRDGRIFLACRKYGIAILDPRRGTVESVIDGPARGKKFRSLNDLVFHSSGDLYFTDQGRTGLQDPTGCVYCLKADGSLQTVIDTVPSPNGLVFNPAETELFVAVTRANAIWWVDMVDPERRGALFVQMHAQGPDGLAMDAAGNLVIAHAYHGAVWVYDRDAAPLYYLKSPRDKMTTNIAYGGPENKTLHIVESATCAITRVTLPVPGQPMFSHLPENGASL
ncbi:MAG TPA: SMP-30/gluconolactonase/LRE family protein [Rhodopila sp.]|jgi:gluconolactonase